MRFAKHDSWPQNRSLWPSSQKCSDDFLSKSLIALMATIDSAQVGLTRAPDPHACWFPSRSQEDITRQRWLGTLRAEVSMIGHGVKWLEPVVPASPRGLRWIAIEALRLAHTGDPEAALSGRCLTGAPDIAQGYHPSGQC
jgi:hypothetical protein